MGVNVVVIAQNQRGVSLKNLMEQLASDRYGIHAARGIANHTEASDDEPLRRPWLEFTWEGQRYFSWLDSPRLKYLDLYQEEANAPNPCNAMQITFLRIMVVLEKITGGMIYVGNDVINRRYPEPPGDREEFFLPMRLDHLIPDWRRAGAIEPAETGLIF
jgi:hypothetical protein